MRNTQSLYFLQNNKGELVRSLKWETQTLYVIYRFDSYRIETLTDLTELETKEIQFETLQTISKDAFSTKDHVDIQRTHLKLIAKPDALVMPQLVLNEDRFDVFETTLKRTGAVCIAMILLFLGIHFIFPTKPAVKQELQIVQVIDRKNLKEETSLLMKPMKKNKEIPVMKKKITKLAKIKPRPSPKFAQRGEVGILGALKSSSQRGGLQLDKVGASRGIGRGGDQGSGGIQTAVYSKGLFSAPLGSGNRPQGAGGYGTKGKGGGKAGYGKQSLVGASESYFEPVTSETWVQGGLDPNEIAAVIQRHESEIRACYEKALQSRPNLSGRLSMKFLIGAKGQVTTASISNSSLGHSGVENCIQSRLRTWPFPRPEGGVTVKVNYPFILRRVVGT
ncbi:MAG: AgmX/PglI C-terminal domain-containing protein [Pseudobdellovibrionaceae bacterium]